MTRRSVSAGRVCVFLLAVAALASSLTLNALPLPKAADNAGKHDATVASAPAGKAPVFLVAPSISVAGKPAAIVAGDLNGDGAPDLIVANAQTGNVDVLLSDGKGAFQAPVHYKIGGSPTALVLGDFTGHGKIDIAVANQSGNSVSVLLGKGDGTFQAAVTYTVGAGPVALAVGDFNGDGHPDLLVANAGSNTLAVLTNNGDGTFQSAKFCALSASPLALAIADFNSDGKLDVASGNADGTVSILLGDGTGRLNIAATMTAATRVSALVVGDFNADGRADLAVADPVASTVSVFLGRGDGTFQSSSVLAVGNEPVSLALEDLNADGVPDLLAVNKSGNTVSVMLGAGNGSFQPSLDCVVGNSPVAVAIADFNGDGHLDLATANSADGTVTVPLGNGDGTFQAAQDYRTHLERKSVAVGDLNGDGHPDVVVASLCGSDPECAGNGTASVFLSNGKGALKPGSIYALGKGPISIALADVNGDKKLDLIAVNRDDATVMVLLGNGDGTFQEGVTYPAGVNPVSVSVGDFNKDGKPDLAVAALCGSAGCNQQGGVNILLGNGDGSFKFGASYDVDFAPVSVAVGDVNGDGALDLVVANSCGKSAACSNGTASVLLGDGKGNFTLKTEVDLGKQVSSVALADLNGDGKLDLIAANSADNQVGVLLGKGDGTFNNQVKYEVGVGPSGVVVADFDGDGLPDVAVANLKNSTVSLLHGNGDGSLQTAVAYPVGFGPDALAALDLTGSARPALVTANGNSGGSPVGNDITVLATTGITAGTTASTTTLTASPNPSLYGQSVAFQATVTGASGTPTGNVQFMDGATDLGSPVALDGTGAATLNWATLDVAHSPHSITAVYSGDATYASSTSSPVSQTVNAATPTIAVTGVSPASETYGQDAPVTITAVLSWTGSGTAPTASDVTIGGNGPSTYGTTSCGAPSGNTITCTATYTPTTADTQALSPYTETAAFTADSNYNAASSPQTNNFTIGKQTPTVNVTNVSVPSEAYGSGTATTVTATLAWTGGGAAPTGGLTFGSTAGGSYGAPNCTGASSPITCTATFTPTATDALGTYTMSASYAGDTNYSPASSPQTNNFSIGKQTPTVNVTSVSPASEAYGSGTTTTVTATLAWTGGGAAPTGRLTFGSTAGGSYGAAICTGASSPITCTATFTPTATDAPGTYTMSASYAGDTNYSPASSPQTNNFTINKATTSIAVTSVILASEVYGQDAQVTITAVLSWTGIGAAPTASDVTFGGNGPSGTYATTGCGAPSGDTRTCTGTYTPTVADTVPSSPYTETATFSGDSNYTGSSSPQTKNFVINQATTTTAVTSGTNPSFVNQSVTFKATVTPQYSGTPTGTVSFTANGNPISPACTGVTLNGSSQATCTYAGFAAGSYTVTASYSGDGNFLSSVSSGSGNVTQVVNKTATATAFCTTPTCASLAITPSVTNSTITFTFAATVTPALTGVWSPVGETITFMDTSTSTLLGTSGPLTLNQQGVLEATFVLTTELSTGNHLITAVYSGDPNFVGSTSAATSLSFEAPGSQTVVSGQPSGGVSLTPNGATAGTAVTFSCLGIGGTGISGVLAPNPAGYFTNPNGNGVTPFVSCWFTSLTSTAPAGTTLTICTALPAPTNCTTGLTVGVVRPNLELRPHRTWYSLALFLPAITFLGAAVPFAIGFRKGKFRRRNLIGFIGLLLVGSLVLLLPACGGGFAGLVKNPAPGAGSTPVGSYTVTVQSVDPSDGSVQIYSVPLSVVPPG